MGRYAALVCASESPLPLTLLLSGPAGSGKSTFCSALISHAHSIGRNVHLFNLDPAAERFEYAPSIDIRDLIGLEDVMSEMGLGPNGALVYCFEYLLNNLDWLEEQLGAFNDDYLIIDCPGQIELYTHTPLISRLSKILQLNYQFRICACYLLESHFIDDRPKFFAGTLSAMSAMINLECPHINILSKMDLLKRGDTGNTASSSRAGGVGGIGGGGLGNRELERYLDPDPTLLINEINESTNPRFHELNKGIVQLIDDFAMVNFMPLDVTDDDSVGMILSHIDNTMQYGEDEEPKEPKDMDTGDFDES